MHKPLSTSPKSSPATNLSVQLVVVQGHSHGKRFNVSAPRYVIGRDPSCQLRPRSESVSARHAEITIEDGRVTLSDLDSQAETLVNGQTVAAPVGLNDGDRIRIGPLTFRVLIQHQPAPARKKAAGSSTLDDAVAYWVSADDNE